MGLAEASKQRMHSHTLVRLRQQAPVLDRHGLGVEPEVCRGCWWHWWHWWRAAAAFTRVAMSPCDGQSRRWAGVCTSARVPRQTSDLRPRRFHFHRTWFALLCPSCHPLGSCCLQTTPFLKLRLLICSRECGGVLCPIHPLRCSHFTYPWFMSSANRSGLFHLFSILRRSTKDL